MNYTDLRLGAGVSAATVGTGAAKWTEIITSNAGTIATLVGATLSLVLIVVHIRRIKYDHQAAELARIKAELEIEEIRVRLEKAPHG